MTEPRARASYEQYAALIEFMESHGDLARPQSAAQGRSRSDQLWGQLTGMLNSIGSGVSKPVEKWKKVWADWKTKTKSKARNIRNHSRGTGGGPHIRQRLNALEERVLAVMGEAAVSGQADIEERGLSQTHSLQTHTQTIDASSFFITQQNQDNNLDNGFYIEELVCQPSHQSFAPTPEPVASPLVAPARTARESPEPVAGPSSAPVPPAPARAVEPEPARAAAGQAAPPARAPAPRTPRRAGAQRHQATTPQSAASSPRHVLRPRRRRTLTPFDRAVTEFVSVEQRRLQFEETRERNLHELERERLRLERDRIEVFRTVAEVGRALLVYLTSKDDTVRLSQTNE